MKDWLLGYLRNFQSFSNDDDDPYIDSLIDEINSDIARVKHHIRSALSEEVLPN